jgi:hypothetical protein
MLGTSATSRRISLSVRDAPFLPASVIGVSILVGLFLRLAAAGGDLWLDEIWSLESAQQASSPLAILTGLHHDNNHILNTLYLRMLGPGLPTWVYRLGAILCGTASIPLAGYIARRWGQIESLSAMTLFATSHVLIHYSSEARGYGFLVFLLLASFESLLRFFDGGEGKNWWIVAFTGCSAAGLLAHPVFVQFTLAMTLGTLFVQWRSGISWMQAIKRTVACHAAAFAFAVIVYRVHWSAMELGGGPKYEFAAKIAETFSLVLGGPTFGGGSIAVAIQCVAAIALGLWAVLQKRSDIAALMTLAVAIPLVQALALRPPFLFVRYFLVAIVFGMFALAVGLGNLYQRRTSGRWAYACLLCGFLAANTCHTIELVRLGRGSYRAALEFMAETTDSPTVTISSDHNFGVSKLVEFHGRQTQMHKQFQYVAGQQWPPEGPQWLVLHRDAENRPVPAEKLLTIEGHNFGLARMFDCAPLSGWQWLCYRKLPE